MLFRSQAGSDECSVARSTVLLQPTNLLHVLPHCPTLSSQKQQCTTVHCRTTHHHGLGNLPISPQTVRLHIARKILYIFTRKPMSRPRSSRKTFLDIGRLLPLLIFGVLTCRSASDSFESLPDIPSWRIVIYLRRADGVEITAASSPSSCYFSRHHSFLPFFPCSPSPAFLSASRI